MNEYKVSKQWVEAWEHLDRKVEELIEFATKTRADPQYLRAEWERHATETFSRIRNKNNEFE